MERGSARRRRRHGRRRRSRPGCTVSRRRRRRGRFRLASRVRAGSGVTPAAKTGKPECSRYRRRRALLRRSRSRRLRARAPVWTFGLPTALGRVQPCRRRRSRLRLGACSARVAYGSVLAGRRADREGGPGERAPCQTGLMRWCIAIGTAAASARSAVAMRLERHGGVDASTTAVVASNPEVDAAHARREDPARPHGCRRARARRHRHGALRRRDDERHLRARWRFGRWRRWARRKVFDPAKVVVVPDHFIPAKDTRSAELQKLLREWSREQGVTYYEQGRGGIEHTVLVEEGWVVPGSVIAGGDSHTCTYGALGAFGTGPRLDRHRRLPRLRQLLAGRAGDDPGRVHRREGPLRHRQGPDPRRDRRDRRRRRDEHGARVRRRRAPRRCRSTSGSRSRTWPSRPAPRRASSRPTRRSPRYLDGRTDRPWTRGAAPTRTPSSRATVRIDLDALPPLVALPHSPGNVVPLDRGRRPEDRPGLHRQLLERDDDRPAPGGRDAPRAPGPPAHPRDHRPRDAAGLPGGARGGPARPVRRGRRARLGADLRRLLRRQRRRSSRRARTRSRRRTETSGAGWGRARPASISRTRGSPRRPPSPARSSTRRSSRGAA